MEAKLLRLFLVVVVVLCAWVEGGPAYPQNNFNSWETPQQPTTRSPNRNQLLQQQEGTKTLQSLVRDHIDDLDKQTRSDLKVLTFLETELNKIFSCYIKLSCARMRSARVLAECDEIKDWPLYHQVMKMAGIRKYPYQSYGPTQSRRIPITEPPTMDLFQNRITDSSTVDGHNMNHDGDEESEEVVVVEERPTRQRQNSRRIRKDREKKQD